jgi:hypothetical protein
MSTICPVCPRKRTSDLRVNKPIPRPLNPPHVDTSRPHPNIQFHHTTIIAPTDPLKKPRTKYSTSLMPDPKIAVHARISILNTLKFPTPNFSTVQVFEARAQTRSWSACRNARIFPWGSVYERGGPARRSRDRECTGGRGEWPAAR